MLGLSLTVLVPELTHPAWATCSDCLNNPNIQTLSIFIHHDAEYPYLTGNATIMIIPNPLAHTVNASDIDPSTWGRSLIVTDGDPLDSDPTVGVIELTGVNNGTYAIYDLKNPSGVLLNDEPVYAEINGSTNDVSIVNLALNSTDTSETTMPPPAISESTVNLLANSGAKINDVLISSAEDLPFSKIVSKANAATTSAPIPVVFSNKATTTSASLLFANLNIPKYSSPVSSYMTDSAFIPPLFKALDDKGNHLVMTPVLDKVSSGTELHMRLDNVGLAAGKSPLHDISIPFATGGTNVGLRVQVNDNLPYGFPPAPPAAKTLFLDVDAVGDIDLGDPTNFSENPKIIFNVDRNPDNSCPSSTVYLYDAGKNQWVTLSTAAQRNTSIDTTKTCGYVQSVPHFSSYMIGSGSSGSSSSSSSSTSSPSDTSSGGSGSSGGGGLIGVGPGGGGSFSGSVNNGMLSIYEVDYDMCIKNQVSVLAGTTGSPDSLGVKIRTPSSGVVTSTMDANQPLKSQNAYWFTVPFVNKDPYFSVYVENTFDSISKSMSSNSCTGKIVFSTPSLNHYSSSSNMPDQQSSEMAKNQPSSIPVIPEFGPVTAIVLGISILSMMLLSRAKSFVFR